MSPISELKKEFFRGQIQAMEDLYLQNDNDLVIFVGEERNFEGGKVVYPIDGTSDRTT
uniref:Uncharacterized protein n=1 Tax=Rhizophagus irregularis (strain DAOM 181602 / DAOM 197198 / MUCL 43194) TaxID=747089 RepID=U9UFV6_RHIID